MNKKLFMPFLALSALVLIIGCIKGLSGEDDWICKEGMWIKHGMPSAAMPTAPCNNAAIKVTNLKINQGVFYPFIISGEAKVFENQFNYRIKDSKGVLLKEGIIYAKDGKFEVKVAALKTKDTKILVEVFDESAKDGSEINKVIIPLQIKY
jgi:hypothetical protein